jgi:EAL domain-containing protein (putative c-di-GMP-specific phosphodiesterase class I)
MNEDLASGALLGAPLSPPPRQDNRHITPEMAIQRILRGIREHLQLDVAFVGEVVGGQRVFRFVDSTVNDVISVGGWDPEEETYCHYVLEGRLPGCLPAPMEHPLAASLPVTTQLPVGSHLSVPIRFSDGRIFGTFCCFALEVRPSVSHGDLRAMELMADLVGEYLESLDAAEREHGHRRRQVESVLEDPAAMEMAFQPLFDLDTMNVVGLEALARFPGHEQGPAWFFSEAAAVGLGVELEMRAVQAAISDLPHIPAPIQLNVNVSPDTLYNQDFFEAVAGVPPDRLVIEVTEHAAIDDYAELKTASARLTDQGIWLAIDDVGMGFSGLNRILESSPEELKLDAAVIRQVEVNPVKQALVEAFCSFGSRAGFNIVAEGIETASELDSLRALGVKIGQGYHLARPGDLGSSLSLLR